MHNRNLEKAGATVSNITNLKCLDEQIFITLDDCILIVTPNPCHSSKITHSANYSAMMTKGQLEVEMLS